MAVVPYYFLVWYNFVFAHWFRQNAVVPYYFLVWYNAAIKFLLDVAAVVPYYFLVWYNLSLSTVSFRSRDLAFSVEMSKKEGK